eukprot:633107-Lingulodinium_polyedra.AAC.1
MTRARPASLVGFGAPSTICLARRMPTTMHVVTTLRAVSTASDCTRRGPAAGPAARSSHACRATL